MILRQHNYTKQLSIESRLRKLLLKSGCWRWMLLRLLLRLRLRLLLRLRLRLLLLWVPPSLCNNLLIPYYLHTEQWVYVASHCDLHQIRSPTLVFYMIFMVMPALSMLVVLLILLTMSVRIAWSHACYHILLCITHHLWLISVKSNNTACLRQILITGPIPLCLSALSSTSKEESEQQVFIHACLTSQPLLLYC